MLRKSENVKPPRTKRRWLIRFGFALALVLAWNFWPGQVAATASQGASVEDDSRLLLTPFLDGLEGPVFMTYAGGTDSDDDRLFVAERAGRIRLVRNGRLLNEPFLDIRDRVATSGESGLLSVAFPDDFAASGVFYVYYNALVDLAPPAVEGEPNGVCDLSSGCDTVVARFSIGDDANRADPESEEQLLLVNQPYANHNGGQITFGPDGHLYLGLGDGGRGGDPHNLAQNLDSLLGKMLRIKVESTGAYSIPDSNPYATAPPPNTLGVGPTSAFQPPQQEIWAEGLRNPWRFSFDRLTGDLYIADVGQDAYEEVNFQPASSPGGENYGWKALEGSNCYVDPCSTDGYVLPIIEYPHPVGDSVTGGYIYRGTDYPMLDGVYLYADWVVGKIWGAERDGDAWTSQLFLDTGLSYSLVSFAEDSRGELYVLDLNGTIYRIVDLASLHARPMQLFLPLIMED